MGVPYHYRDDRTAAAVDRVHAKLGHPELYARNGLQFLPFNTLYQLAAEPDLALAERMLLVPDLLAHWLTGQEATESTNASTTGLLGLDGRWDDELIELLGYPRRLFGELVEPGTTIGRLLPDVAEQVGAGLTVTAVGSHDTASAVLAVPIQSDDAAYISCGTWGLVGVELDHPVVTEESRMANFTNERGVGGRTQVPHERDGDLAAQRDPANLGASGDSSGADRAARGCRGRDRAGPRVRRAGPALPPARRHARPDRAVVRRARPRGAPGAGRPGGARPLHRGEPGAGLRLRPGHRRSAVGPSHRHGAPGRRRVAEPAAVPGGRGSLRPPGGRRAGRGDGAGQRARPGGGAGRGPRRPRGDAPPRRRHPGPGRFEPAAPSRDAGRVRGMSRDEGRADGHVRQRRDVPGHRQGGRDAAAPARGGRRLPRRPDLLRPADGEHRLPRRGDPGGAHLRRRVRRLRRGGHAVRVVRRIGPPPARDRRPAQQGPRTRGGRGGGRAAGSRAQRVPGRRARRRGRRSVVPAPGHLPPDVPLAADARRRRSADAAAPGGARAAAGRPPARRGVLRIRRARSP